MAQLKTVTINLHDGQRFTINANIDDHWDTDDDGWVVFESVDGRTLTVHQKNIASVWSVATDAAA